MNETQFLIDQNNVEKTMNHSSRTIGMSNFNMGTILGKSTFAEGMSAMNCMHMCLSKTLYQNCLHDEIVFSNST